MAEATGSTAATPSVEEVTAQLAKTKIESTQEVD